MPTDTGFGILIAFEGIDGAGKTTQVRLLAEALESVGEEVITSKEPTNGPWGQKIRESASNGRLPLEEELEAFVQDRVEHVSSVITPSLKAGKVVILDRYFYSTIAYQGARGANIEAIDEHMRSFAPIPDVVYVLDLDPHIALARVRMRDDVPNEFEKVESLYSVRSVFRRLVDFDQMLWEVDGSMPIEIVHQSILRHLLDTVIKSKRCAKEYGCDDPVHCIPRMTGTCRWAEMRSRLVLRFENSAEVPRRRRVATLWPNRL